MAFRLLSAILRGKWLIEENFAANQLPLVASLISGNQIPFAGNEKPVSNPYYTAENNDFGRKPLVAIGVIGGTIKESYYRTFDEAPEGSIALIPINGPILKYGGECGEPGSIHMMDWVKQASASSKISSIIFRIDSPGGMVDGTASLADAIKNAGKPTIGFVDDGMMASAAMWLGSSCDQIFASQKTDMIGSIGVFTTLYDFEERLKMMGVQIHEIYAPQSGEKNLDYKQALKGNYKAVQDELRFICDQFITTIKSNRAGKLNLSAGDPFKGAMYFAEEALAIGLIDGIKSFDQVVADLMISQNSGNSNQSVNSTSTTMFGTNFKKVAALKGKTAAEITAEELQAANAELVVEGITGVIMGPDQSVHIQQLESQLAEATQKSEDLANTITSLQSEIAALGKQPGEKPTIATKVAEVPGADTKAGTKFEDYDHNKAALKELENL